MRRYAPRLVLMLFWVWKSCDLGLITHRCLFCMISGHYVLPLDIRPLIFLKILHKIPLVWSLFYFQCLRIILLWIYMAKLTVSLWKRVGMWFLSYRIVVGRVFGSCKLRQLLCSEWKCSLFESFLIACMIQIIPYVLLLCFILFPLEIFDIPNAILMAFLGCWRLF